MYLSFSDRGKNADDAATDEVTVAPDAGTASAPTTTTGTSTTVTTTTGTTRKTVTRVSSVVVSLGIVSMFTDISSESVSAILPLYITGVLGLSTVAYGFIDGLYQGVSAIVRIAGGWAADRGDQPKWIAFFGYGIAAIARVGLLFASGFAAITAIVAVDRIGKGIRTAPRDALISASSTPANLGRVVRRAPDARHGRRRRRAAAGVPHPLLHPERLQHDLRGLARLRDPRCRPSSGSSCPTSARAPIAQPAEHAPASRSGGAS